MSVHHSCRTIAPYPLQFQPCFKEKVWGGRALAQFNSSIPKGAIGEAWLIADHPNGISLIKNGIFSGKSLNEVRKLTDSAWFGSKVSHEHNDRFPLLIKILDCNDDLSVQVHPDDTYENLPPNELGKTEMWYVLQAKPKATLIYGLKEGVTRAKMIQAIHDDKVMEVLNEVPVQAGDTFFIPAGTVHALRAGVVVAEIQQNSDTTYRLYDYHRQGLDGKLRELHIEDSLNVISYAKSDARRKDTSHATVGQWLSLAESEYFKTEKGIVQGRWSLATSLHSFTILIVCEGTGKISWNNGEISMHPGDAFLLPANLGNYQLEGSMTVLRSYLP